MKSIFVRIALLCVILCSYSLQAFTPPLPPTTTVKLTGLQWLNSNNQFVNYYKAKVNVSGPLMSNPSTPASCVGEEVLQPRSTEWFLTCHQFYSVQYSLPFYITVWGKKTSSSPWEIIGSGNSELTICTKTVVDNYLVQIEFAMFDLGSFEVPIEE